MLTGVETVRANGRPTVFSNGTISSSPITTACNPNEVNVVQLLRVRWAHDVSSMLSANMVSSKRENLLAAMDTIDPTAIAVPTRKKRPRFHAACWNFSDTQGVRFNYFGSLAFGVVGLGVVPKPV